MHNRAHRPQKKMTYMAAITFVCIYTFTTAKELLQKKNDRNIKWQMKWKDNPSIWYEKRKFGNALAIMYVMPLQLITIYFISLQMESAPEVQLKIKKVHESLHPPPPPQNTSPTGKIIIIMSATPKSSILLLRLP